MWVKEVRKNDSITLVFDVEQHLETIYIQMATDKSPNDYLHYGVLEVAPRNPENAASQDRLACGEYQTLTTANADQKDATREEKSVLYWETEAAADSPVVSQVKCLRIRVTQAQNNWLAVASINIKAQQV
eukprot:GEMP01055854.1.p1 GENE.GEMP01055854.1~~GEMP01055854.1.p1  ORF type:complete len:130 (+),score=40.64 GEMP01055854.1:277-666(+)